MQGVMIASGLGAASGVLGAGAFRFRLAWLGWLALAPLTVAAYLYSPLAVGLAGALCGTLLATANHLVSVPRSMPGGPLMEAGSALMSRQGGASFSPPQRGCGQTVSLPKGFDHAGGRHCARIRVWDLHAPLHELVPGLPGCGATRRSHRQARQPNRRGHRIFSRSTRPRVELWGRHEG